MSWSIFIGVVFIGIGVSLLYLQYRVRRYTIGNVWKTKHGKIAIIVDYLDSSKEYCLVVEIEKEKRYYNIKGEAPGMFSKGKLVQHLGTKKQVPEYFL